MYSIKLDENKYFTGSYAIIGKVEDGIDINTLPPDMDKATFYKYDYHDVVTTEQVPDIDTETGEPKVDELGNPLYIEQSVITSVLDWIYDDEKYQAHLTEEANKVPELTLEEKIVSLQEDNDLLKGCVMELANILFA